MTAAATVLLPGFVVLSILASAVTLLAHALAHRHLARPPAPAGATRRDEERLPPVSVLKPVKGDEAGLFAGLVALAHQDYPCFEVVIGAADPADPALATARAFAVAFPGTEVRVVAGAPPLGGNPKVRVLAELARQARYEHLLVSDADVLAPPGYLRGMARALVTTAAEDFAPPHRRGSGGGRPASRVGLVSSLLTGGGGGGSAAARLDELHLATFVAPAVALAQTAGHPCVVGKSMLFRRSDLARVGGWDRVADVLAEDYLLGRAMAAAGLRVELAPRPLRVVSGRVRLRDLFARHLRWGQMRWRIAPAAYLAEALLQPVPWLVLLAAAGLVADPGPGATTTRSALLVAAAGLAAKLAADTLLLRALNDAAPRLATVLAIPAKDLLLAGAWLVAPWRSTVVWRGQRMRIGAGSRLQPAGRRAVSAPGTTHAATTGAGAAAPAPSPPAPPPTPALRPVVDRASRGLPAVLVLGPLSGGARPRLPPAVRERLAEEAAA